MKTKIIDAGLEPQIVYLTANEARDNHVICQGLERVDIYLPSKQYFVRNTDPLIISREKMQQPVFIHSLDARFQNQFDAEMLTMTLDVYYSRTIRLILENRSHQEWYVVSNGIQAYDKRDTVVEIYGTSFYTEGTTPAYFFEGAFQTSNTSTSYPGVRSFLYDHDFVDIKISTARGEFHFNKPGNYIRKTYINLLSESTEPTTFRFRLRRINDYNYDESGYDIFLTADSGTHRHNLSDLYNQSITKTHSTHAAFNTSGSPYEKVIVGYDIVVTGDGTWYAAPDLPENSNPSWNNKIYYELAADSDIQSALFGTSFLE